MLPDDPRHGSEAGEAQHIRDGEEVCDSCRDAKRRASRRRTKRRTMGYVYTRPVGKQAHERLAALHRKGATWHEIAEWSGLSTSQVWRIVTRGPDEMVHVRTVARIAAMTPGRIVTPIGITRRMRALACLGWSLSAIAREAGVHMDTVLDSRASVREFLGKRTESGLADAYDRLSMNTPEPRNQQEKAGITRNRNLAKAEGWAPPLAWDDIDDPDAKPHGTDVCKRETCQGAVLAKGLCSNHYKQQGHPARQDVDPVVVDRVIAGEWSLPATPNERAEVCRRWVANGRSLQELERLTGWKPERYYTIAGAA